MADRRAEERHVLYGRGVDDCDRADGRVRAVESPARLFLDLARVPPHQRLVHHVPRLLERAVGKVVWIDACQRDRRDHHIVGRVFVVEAARVARRATHGEMAAGDLPPGKPVVRGRIVIVFGDNGACRRQQQRHQQHRQYGDRMFLAFSPFLLPFANRLGIRRGARGCQSGAELDLPKLVLRTRKRP